MLCHYFFTLLQMMLISRTVANDAYSGLDFTIPVTTTDVNSRSHIRESRASLG
jgi:hypothetical protein